MDREVRNLTHKKSPRSGVKKGEPTFNDLTDGISQYRLTKEGLVEYILHNRTIYKKIFEKVT